MIRSPTISASLGKVVAPSPEHVSSWRRRGEAYGDWDRKYVAQVISTGSSIHRCAVDMGNRLRGEAHHAWDAHLPTCEAPITWP